MTDNKIKVNDRPVRILLTESIHQSGIRLLRERFTVKFAKSISQDAIIESGKDCQGMLVRIARITGETMKKLPDLKIIARHGVGTDNVDLKAAAERRITVTNAKGSNTDSVAEHALGLMLALSKNMLNMDREVRNGNFGIRYMVTAIEMLGKTVGIIGFGEIGRALAGKLAAMGLKIIAYDPYIPAEKYEGDIISMKKNLEEVLKGSDIISIHVPYNTQTHGLIGRKELDIIKKDALLINVSRGGVVDEEALYDALKEKRIRGAGIDVFEKEPTGKDNPLFGLDNVILSPHSGALTEEAMIRMAMVCSRSIIDYFEGRKPQNIVNNI